MFASVLREVTGHFDRRALVSTFFPVLVFLGGTVLLVWATVSGVDGAVAAWGRRPATVQVLVVVGFLVLCAFLTFVVGNLREWQDRVCQGHWPSWASRVEERRKRVHRVARQALMDRDDALQREEEALAGERHVFPRSDDAEPGSLTDGEVDRALRELAELPARSDWPVGASARLAGVARSLRGETSARVRAFSELVFRLDAHLAAVEQRVREERAEAQQELFLWYPQPPHDVRPTGMGNVVRAAEQHPSVRYRLDAVVMWTRLQPVLPKDFADALKDAKVSVDLLLTLAAFLPLFGVPLSWWLAWRLPRVVGTPAAWLTVAAVVVCAFAAVHHGRGLRGRLAVVGAAVALVALGSWSPALRVEIGLLWTIALLVVAHGLYRNATHAALAYAERLRTAFDLYRWKLLEELRLKPPETLEAERVVWRDLSQFLYRGGTTHPDRVHYEHPKPETPA